MPLLKLQPATTTLLIRIERCMKWLCVSATLGMLITGYYKDTLPPPTFYDDQQLSPPSQTPTDALPFYAYAENQRYLITPKFVYELEGIVVTFNDADQFGNIWHHRRWHDFINLRDVCVIWGKNVTSGIYKHLHFSSDSWTCWVTPPNAEIARQFKGTELSNNHLLITNEMIKKRLMRTEKGDHIRFKGYLATYENKANGFYRGTSTTRDDTGNGACETVFLTSFELVKKANSGLRSAFSLFKWLAIISGFLFFCLMCITPLNKKRAK